MSQFNQVCERLIEAVSMEGASELEVKPAIPFDGENSKIQGKLQRQFNDWQGHDEGKNTKFQLTPAGCCEIGGFTGNQLLRIFSNLLQDKNLNKPGKYLDFLVNGEVCFIILFLKDRALPITQPQDDTKKRLFSKLFDDGFVERNKIGEYRHQYTDEAIRQLRLRASKEYPDFLNKKLAECSSLEFRFPFLGLLLDLAVRMDENEPYRKVKDEIKLIPFPACIKLAFDQENSGLVTKLLGETGYIEHNHVPDRVYSRKAETAISTCKSLIESEKIPRVKKGNRQKVEDKIVLLVNKIHQLYKMKDN